MVVASAGPSPLVAGMTPGPLVLCAGFSVLFIYDMYHSDDLYRSPYRPCGCGMWFLVSVLYVPPRIYVPCGCGMWFLVSYHMGGATITGHGTKYIYNIIYIYEKFHGTVDTAIAVRTFSRTVG